jgi:hypothetical protein
MAKETRQISAKAILAGITTLKQEPYACGFGESNKSAERKQDFSPGKSFEVVREGNERDGLKEPTKRPLIEQPRIPY